MHNSSWDRKWYMLSELSSPKRKFFPFIFTHHSPLPNPGNHYAIFCPYKFAYSEHFIQMGSNILFWLPFTYLIKWFQGYLCFHMYLLTYSCISTYPQSMSGSDSKKNLPVIYRRPGFDPWVEGDPREEKGMTIHFSILAWRIPRTRGAWRLQSIASQNLRHSWVINTEMDISPCLSVLQLMVIS